LFLDSNMEFPFDYGPVRENYYDLLNALVKMSKLQVREVPVGEHIGIEYKSLEESDLSHGNKRSKTKAIIRR